jgi:hypothetical protein
MDGRPDVLGTDGLDYSTRPRLPIVQSMNIIEAIVPEHIQVLTAIDACSERPVSTRPPARPGRPYGEGHPDRHERPSSKTAA